MAIRTLVVDDSIVFRKCVRDALASVPGVEVIDIARDGTSAVEKIVRLHPDLITLDVEMPGLNGLEVLEELGRRGLHANVLMLSSLTRRGAEVTTQALSLGALDFILKPDSASVQENLEVLRRELAKRVQVFQHRLGGGDEAHRAHPAPGTAPIHRSGPIICSATARPAAPAPSVKASGSAAAESGPAVRASVSTTASSAPKAAPSGAHCELIVIGISTGGPKALAHVIPQIPASFPIPIVIVQHMPPLFTATMASHLDARSGLHVVEASDGLPLKPGQVVIAPGGQQMGLEAVRCGGIVARITEAPAVKGCKPSVDYCLGSIDAKWASRTLAVIMTGMGDDGLDGCGKICRHGGSVWAQSEATCTVYGMPRQVVDHGLTESIFRLSDLPSWLTGLRSSGSEARRSRPSDGLVSFDGPAMTGTDWIGGVR